MVWIFDEEKRSEDQKVDETDPTSIFEQSREHLSPGFEMWNLFTIANLHYQLSW